MRPTVRLCVRPIPLSSIPPLLLRLPPQSSPTSHQAERRRLKQASPTMEALAKKLAQRAAPLDNLRLHAYVPKRKEWEGVASKHRVLLQRLRREA
ncbi:BZ3500_MvSof-1268-A1-R1_Chr12-2g03922 [Microbotryum saponariae]|uniref:BZ3500_MvSof-1268-A1-R1_Chr12-2g03922 protein n=1 Tax=Microbotryum saponariae TaxID=289078 RepID=A0A2X0MPX1_9BASI|nr:BZ3500_MvSof-1268-A1-R1_Chr12-2g03922 [Microbotryum saponariae]SCZ99764.1 BZ3501_MvSof-1269-A2-R1_Chr12-2g03466 [Microbotryum saponariae]